MKILYLAHRIPYPPNKGDKIRTFNQIKFLSQRNDLSIATLCDNKHDLRYSESLKNFCTSYELDYVSPYKKISSILSSFINKKPISVNYFYSSKLQKKINYLLKNNRFDVIFCFCSVMAEYVFNAKEYFANKPLLVMDYCDLDSHKWYQYSKNSIFPMKLIYRYESKVLFEYEKNINKEFDISIFVSDVEKKLFLSKYRNGKNIHVIPNGVDYNFFTPNTSRIHLLPFDVINFISQKKVIMFVGAMDYKPNIDAVLWFVDKVFSKLKKEVKDICFLVVGQNPSDDIKRLHKQNDIFVTGFVKDVRPYYDIAQIIVVPIMIARGIQNKVLEAMSMEKSVVLTNEANEGIWGKDKIHLYLANDKEQFYRSIKDLLNNSEKMQEIGKRARAYVKDNFSWDSHLTKLNTLFKDPM